MAFRASFHQPAPVSAHQRIIVKESDSGF